MSGHLSIIVMLHFGLIDIIPFPIGKGIWAIKNPKTQGRWTEAGRALREKRLDLRFL